MTFSYDLNNKRGLDYFKYHIGISDKLGAINQGESQYKQIFIIFDLLW